MAEESGFVPRQASRPALSLAHIRIQWIPGALSPGVKRQGRETDLSRPSFAGVKNLSNSASISSYVYTLYIKLRPNLTFGLRK